MLNLGFDAIGNPIEVGDVVEFLDEEWIIEKIEAVPYSSTDTVLRLVSPVDNKVKRKNVPADEVTLSNF